MWLRNTIQIHIQKSSISGNLYICIELKWQMWKILRTSTISPDAPSIETQELTINILSTRHIADETCASQAKSRRLQEQKKKQEDLDKQLRDW